MTTQSTAHSPARINPDRTGTLVVVLLLIAALISASAALSYAGLSSVAPWAGIARDMAWLVPVFIEGAILAYTGAGIVHAARGEKRGARQAWSWVTLWTLVSSAANGAHAWDAGPGGWQGIVGVALAALFPIGVLIAVHTAAGLIVATVTVPQLTRAAGAHSPVDEPVDTNSGTDGQPGGHRTDTGARTPDPLVVLEEIEQAASADVEPVAAPVAVTVADGQADIQTDSGADSVADRRAMSVRPVHRAPGAVEAVRPQIETLARQGVSGREIARRLGVGPTRTCEIVRELKTAGERFELVQEVYPA
ncbi:DUF2637 domain-containing protein [Oerskovia sp. NPDC060338]|uniref:DUF2637 domain-containing protein n=1 Tax=Oerskovia sp. NPDC060338 TaxID=3347100 RepID=UPI00364B625F